MQKNVKGIIGLICALASVILTGAAFCLPTSKINGSSISLYGSINVYMCFGAAFLGLLAIIFGILAVRDRDKKGPRKAGIIIGAIAIVIAMCSAGICGLVSAMVDYANGKSDTIVSKLDDETRRNLDEMIDRLKAELPEK